MILVVTVRVLVPDRALLVTASSILRNEIVRFVLSYQIRHLCTQHARDSEPHWGPHLHPFPVTSVF